MGGNIGGYGPASGATGIQPWQIFGWGDYLAVLCQYNAGGGGVVLVYDPEAGGSWRELTHLPTTHPNDALTLIEPWGAGSWGGKLVVVCQDIGGGLAGHAAFQYDEEARSWDLITPDIPATA